MKNLSLSFAIALLAVLCFAGKSNAQSKARVGIKAGLTYTTLGAATSNGISINYDYRPGFQGGVFVETPLSQSISFTAQALYTQKGGSINTTILNTKIDGYTQLNYLDVPLLVGFKANPKLAFYVGPQASFLLSQKTVVSTSSMGSQTSTDKTGTKTSIFGGNIGAGYSITNDIGIHLNYIFDFGHAAESGYDTGERNSGFILGLGFKF
ncbi:porin family protein [Mucilaginibacter calamicampi]|uniref:Porin family protein n=1 Tax=Mucilaginibacter calamicampi TaxID=1302352 RepID=A0ABW2YXE1_9SPHI